MFHTSALIIPLQPSHKTLSTSLYHNRHGGDVDACVCLQKQVLIAETAPLGEPPGEWGVAGRLGDGRPDSPRPALGACLGLLTSSAVEEALG